MWRKRVFHFSDIYTKSMFMLFDLVMITLALYLALLIRWGSENGVNFFDFINRFTGATVLTYGSYLLSFYVFNFYDTSLESVRKERVAFFATAVFVGAVITAVSSFLMPDWKSFRTILALQTIILAIIMASIGYRFRISLRSANLVARKRVLMIGTGKSARVMADLIVQKYNNDFEVIGYLGEKSEYIDQNILGTREKMEHIVKEHKINLIISCVTYAESSENLKSLFSLKMKGCDVIDMPVFYSKLTGKVPVQYVGDEWFVYGPYFVGQSHALFVNFTRFFDCILAIGVLLLCTPIMVLSIIIIKITMPGPIFYLQTRIGENQVPYRIIKFRSMPVNAEKSTGPTMSKGDHDQRITPFGRIMRRTRIDELPQLFNILRGEMSFIGPRPERPYYVEKLLKTIPYYGLRYFVKPGLTGWAQVNLRYDEKWEENSLEKLQYDLYYIQESSIFLNIVILLKTLQTIILRPGS